MTEQHPITPPPIELVQAWLNEEPSILLEQHIALRAAQWGADQELEACCEWLQGVGDLEPQLRAARRPKPLNLKEQALEDLEILIADLANHGMGFRATNIRRALESIPDNTSGTR